MIIKEIQATRAYIGTQLTDLRISKNILPYHITKSSGLRHEQISAIETGLTGYTVDNLIKYMHAINGNIIMMAVNESMYSEIKEMIKESKRKL